MGGACNTQGNIRCANKLGNLGYLGIDGKIILELM